MIDLNFELKNLNSKLSSFTQDVGKLEGQMNLLSSQITQSKNKIEILEAEKITETKAVELLHNIQRATRDKIKAAFEQTVTFALQSIYKQDYKFQLEFTQRGNLGELNFKLKSPETEGYLDLENCTAGGSLDIISLALRFVLLQIIRPKVEGFIILDEPTKQLSRNFRDNEFEFYNTMANKLNRQLIIITHAQELINRAENKILIGD